MPIEVDEVRRRNEIAAATLQVARESGVRSVTIRAVAARLGGSTTMVTNYISSRSALMLNAIRCAEEEWERDQTEALDGLAGPERLRSFAQWMCTTERDDVVLRRLLMEVVGEASADGEETAVERDLRAMSRKHRKEIHDSAVEAGLPDAELSADVLHLLLRGYWLSVLEDPQTWTSETGTRTVLAVIDLLRGQANGDRADEG
ncbi:TetR/AcrR family transcriptional regulator [Streptomyces graminilatus]|uniref:TetR/AcrR family transcriptional regulator n=1 Tax=Streptomyces graminilatus TaxID=1464070 RepID=UPI0006E2D2C2|nr:TetR family transcriptional regulator C-terminal domain-containing protein [Streptomyces graminilatus]